MRSLGLAVDLRQLSYFVAVAEEGQVTRAAVRVSVAQPAVSAALRRLEREVGEALFRRDPRGTRLTAAGEALLPHARTALVAVERGRDSIASLRGLLHGRLRVGVSRPVDRRLVGALGEFHRAHPAVEIAVAEQHNEPLIDALAAGNIDVALVGFHDHPLPAGTCVRVVATEPVVLAVAPGHRLDGRSCVAVDDLRNEPVITLIRGSGLRTVLEDACHAAGFSPRIVAETSELASVVELVAEGLGVALAPRSAVTAELTVLEVTRPRIQRRNALAWNPATATPAGRAFLTLADTHLPTALPG